MNRCIVSGAISSYGVKLAYTQASKPQLTFTLDITEGDYHTFVLVQIVGHNAETLAEVLEPGEYLLLEGKLSWTKAQQKLQVVAYGVERLSSAGTETHADAPAWVWL